MLTHRVLDVIKLLRKVGICYYNIKRQVNSFGFNYSENQAVSEIAEDSRWGRIGRNKPLVNVRERKSDARKMRNRVTERVD